MWRERTFCALQVNQRYAQNQRVAHDIEPDSGATHVRSTSTPPGIVAVLGIFATSPVLGKGTTLDGILRGRIMSQALHLQVQAQVRTNATANDRGGTRNDLSQNTNGHLPGRSGPAPVYPGRFTTFHERSGPASVPAGDRAALVGSAKPSILLPNGWAPSRAGHNPMKR